MLDSLTTIQVEPRQWPSHQSILLTQEPIHKFSQKIIENWRSWKMTFFRRPFWIFFSEKNFFFCFILLKRPKAFIWGIIFFCTMDEFFRILEKTSSELICTRLYVMTGLSSSLARFGNNYNQPYLLKLWRLLDTGGHLWHNQSIKKKTFF